MNSIITRFAPSPTGNLHIGGIRTALINYIVTQKAKANFPNSKFILRIEDTDIERSNVDYKESILKGLKWLELNYDGEPVLQSQNINRHQEIALKLLNNNNAFKCICSDDLLEKKRKENLSNKISDKKLCKTCVNDDAIQSLDKNYVVRIKIPYDGFTVIEDEIQGTVKVLNKEIDDFILLRKDGSPTYMLSVVVDDHDSNVNLIIRGDDHLNNAFRQNFIYQNMNWSIPKYAHLPLIHGDDGKKLSKRHGAININEFREKGYLKESIINNLILLGWSPNQKEELIKINEIINKFDLKKISKSSSRFSYDKLNFFNNSYINNDINNENFFNYCNKNSILKNILSIDREKISRLFEIYKKDLEYYKSLETIMIPYFDVYFKNKESNLLNDDFNNLISEFFSILKQIKNWNIVNLESEINSFVNKQNIKFVFFGKPLRMLLINSEKGPSISNIFYILGKKDSIQRIKNYIDSN